MVSILDRVEASLQFSWKFWPWVNLLRSRSKIKVKVMQDSPFHMLQYETRWKSVWQVEPKLWPEMYFSHFTLPWPSPLTLSIKNLMVSILDGVEASLQFPWKIWPWVNLLRSRSKIKIKVMQDVPFHKLQYETSWKFVQYHKEPKLWPTKKIEFFHSCYLDPDPMILICELDVDIIEMYLHAKNQGPSWKHSKGIARTDGQTDRHTDTTENITYPHAPAVIIMITLVGQRYHGVPDGGVRGLGLASGSWGCDEKLSQMMLVFVSIWLTYVNLQWDEDPKYVKNKNQGSDWRKFHL